MQYNEHVWCWCYNQLGRIAADESYLLKAAACCW